MSQKTVTWIEHLEMLQHHELDLYDDMCNDFNNDSSAEEDFKELDDAYYELKSPYDEDSVTTVRTSGQNLEEVKKKKKETENSGNTVKIVGIPSEEVQKKKKKKKSKTANNVLEKAEEISDSGKSTQQSNEVLLSSSQGVPQNLAAIKKLKSEPILQEIVKKKNKEMEKSGNKDAASKIETNICSEMPSEAEEKNKKIKTANNVLEKVEEISNQSKSIQESNKVMLSTSQEEVQKELIAAVQDLKLELSLSQERTQKEIIAAVETLKSELSLSQERTQMEILAAVEKLRSELSVTSEKLAQVMLNQNNFNMQMLKVIQKSQKDFLEVARNVIMKQH